MRIAGASLLSILVPASAYPQTPAVSERAIVFAHATVIDVKGGQPTPDMTIVIAGNRIAALGKTGAVRLPTDAQVIDASGKYLIPGLWDLHAHLGAGGAPIEIDMPLLVANGVCARIPH